MVLAARPENLFLSKNEEENSLKGRIQDKIFMGSFMRYRIMLETGDLVLVEIPGAADKSFNIDERVNVTFQPDRLLVYPRPKEGLQEVLSLE